MKPALGYSRHQRGCRLGILAILSVAIVVVCSQLVRATPDHGEIYLRANQVGYGTRRPKIAIAFAGSSLPDTFAVIDADSGASVFAGKPQPLTGRTMGRV